jgi:hypothetical protein
MNNIPKDGSRWTGGNRDTFRILNTVKELEGHTWVHYIKENAEGDPREYSCYLESFLQRFSPLPE